MPSPILAARAQEMVLQKCIGRVEFRLLVRWQVAHGDLKADGEEGGRWRERSKTDEDEMSQETQTKIMGTGGGLSWRRAWSMTGLVSGAWCVVPSGRRGKELALLMPQLGAMSNKATRTVLYSVLRTPYLVATVQSSPRQMWIDRDADGPWTFDPFKVHSQFSTLRHRVS